jgi:Tol biopolymer transport system component
MGIRAFGSEASAKRDLSGLDNGFLGDIAPDGKTIVFVDRDFLFLRRTDGSPPIRLGEGYAFDLARLSPDGKWILTVPASGPRKPVLVPTGAGEVRRFDAAPECYTAEWFPDGKRILIGKEAPGDRSSLFVFEPESGKVSELPVPANLRLSVETKMLSHDGGRIAIFDVKGDVRILSAATGQEIQKVTGAVPGSALIGWSDDGRRLFLYRIGDVPERVQQLDIETGKNEPWRELTLEDPAGLVRIHPVKVTPDSRYWGFSYSRVLSDLYVVMGLK